MKKLSTLLLANSSIYKLRLTGLWQDMFYHVIFVPEGTKYTPFALFENGQSIPLISDSKKGYTYFDDLENKHCIIDTGEPLWFADGVVNTVSKSGIIAVIKKEKIDASALYKSVTQVLEDYYDFYNKHELQVVFAHAVHTYILGLLGKTFYLLLEGDRNTGKSSLQSVMAQLQYNGSFSGKVTMASLIRKIHFFGASVNIDELDKLHKDELKIATGILNSGMYASGTYEIVNLDGKKSQNQLKIYKTFSSKTFSANRAYFDDSLLSRCLVINTVRNQRQVKSIYEASEKEFGHFQHLRNQLFAYCLMNGKAIQNDIKALQEELSAKGKYGRRSDIFSIVAGILKHFGAEHQPVLDYLNERENLDEENSFDNRFYLALSFLAEKINATQATISFSNEDLRKYLIDELDIDDYSQYKPTARSIGSLLKKHRIVESHHERSRITHGIDKGKYEYHIGVVKILELIERSEFDDLKEKIRKIDFKLST